jgi:CYTH domain-containing protein
VKKNLIFFVEKSDSKISKKRYTLYIENNKWEVDEFHELNIIMAELEKLGDNWNNAISLEKEIMSIELPDSIKEVLKEEVTGQVEWSNKTLSLKIKQMFGK